MTYQFHAGQLRYHVSVVASTVVFLKEVQSDGQIVDFYTFQYRALCKEFISENLSHVFSFHNIDTGLPEAAGAAPRKECNVD